MGSKFILLAYVLLQVEFVAEDEIVEIVPNIRMEALNMICVSCQSLHWHLFSFISIFEYSHCPLILPHIYFWVAALIFPMYFMND